MADDYPVNLSIDYPDRKLNRWTTFFRIILAIPILIVMLLLLSAAYNYGGENARTVATGAGFTFLPLVLMLLFRQKYPRWWYDWNLELVRFLYRVAVYLYLMDDRYPSTDEEQSVHITMPYPDAKTELNRWLPLVKWFLAIPHIIVLCFLWIAAVVVIIIVWFAILLTGRYPRGLFDFALGVMRWGFRVMCYAMIMITDKYPPFALDT
jgi:hypothetical protein